MVSFAIERELQSRLLQIVLPIPAEPRRFFAAGVIECCCIRSLCGIGLVENQELAKKIQKVCGVGGTVKDGNIEIQGYKRDEVKRILTEAGFNPVFSGG